VTLEGVNGTGLQCPRCGRPLWFLSKTVDDAVVITFLTGLVSGHATAQQVDELLAAIGRCARLVLDLSRLRFVPPSFLKLLVLLNHRLASSVHLRICGLDEQNSTMLRRTRIDRLFEVFGNQQQALEAGVRPTGQ
jgi:anti-anti-sigma regulatory factor